MLATYNNLDLFVVTTSSTKAAIIHQSAVSSRVPPLLQSSLAGLPGLRRSQDLTPRSSREGTPGE